LLLVAKKLKFNLRRHALRAASGLREDKMAWCKPTAVEISCGMEINMYGPGEDDERDNDLF